MFNSLKTNVALLMQSPKDYLYSFVYSDNSKVEIRRFDPRSVAAAEKLIKKLKRLCPGITVVLIGSVGLGIDGRGDIDLCACAAKTKLPVYYRRITKNFGKPVKIRSEFRQWEFERNGFPVELYLSNTKDQRFKEQVRLFNLLKNNPAYLREYQSIKRLMNHGSEREYVLRRMEFFNRISGQRQ